MRTEYACVVTEYPLRFILDWNGWNYSHPQSIITHNLVCFLGMRTRTDVKQEVLILSDGNSNCGGNATIAAKALQLKAEVFGLMIGSHSQGGMDELTSYVSTPVHEHLFAVASFRELRDLVDYIQSQISLIQCAPFDLWRCS